MRISTTTLQNSFGKYLKLAVEGKHIYIEKNEKPVAILKGIGEEERFLMREEAAAYEVAHQYTYDEFKAIADTEGNVKQYELIHGQIYMMSSPRFNHQKAVHEIFGQFYNWFKGKSCIPLTGPFDVKLFGKAASFDDNPNVVQPDIVVVCDQEEIQEDGTYGGKPSLVVEILSPSTRSKDVMIKSQLYMESGIKEYWIVDTDEKHILIYVFEDCQLKDHRVITKDHEAKSVIYDGLVVATNDVFN